MADDFSCIEWLQEKVPRQKKFRKISLERYPGRNTPEKNHLRLRSPWLRAQKNFLIRVEIL